MGHWLELPEKSRTFIVDTIKRIPERFRPLHLLQASYIPCAPCLDCVSFTRKGLLHGVSGWDDLAQVVWHSNGPVTTPGSAAELVHVQREDLKAEDPTETPGTVVPITYKSLKSLPSLLSARPLSRPPTPFPPEWCLPKPRPVPARTQTVIRPLPIPCFRGQPEMV